MEGTSQAREHVREGVASFEVHKGVSDPVEYEHLDEETLEKICRLEVTQEELDSVDQRVRSLDGKAMAMLLSVLSGRDFKNELPVQGGEFVFRRNLTECKKLQKAAFQLLEKITIKGLDPDDEGDSAQYADVLKLLVLELRKTQWLEDEYYPGVYRRALSVARGEVNQFLVRQANTAELEHFRDAREARVMLKDELNYVLDGHPFESVGVASGDNIALRIPSHFTDREEWVVYLVLVHELVHYASQHECGGVGLRSGVDEGHELNEAITEITTYVIAQDHLGKYKSTLQGERDKNLTLVNMAYNEFTLIVKGIFPKIPLKDFIDALFNEEGLGRLGQKFDEVMGEPGALARYGKKLRDLYKPVHERE